MPKIIKRLTDKEVENAKPKTKNYRLYDGDNLQLLVRTSGTKVWQYPYTFKNKKTFYTIGEYHKNKAGTLGIKEARIKRHEVRALINQGIDPNVRKKERIHGVDGEEETTFEALGREWHSKGTWVPKHAKNTLKSLEMDIFPHIGSKQVTDVTRKDIINIIQAVEARGAYDVAHRICQRCVAIFDHAIVKGVCDDNPALGRSKIIQRPKRQNRPHFKESQLPEFLQKLANYHGRDYVKMAMQLLVITFLRPGELRNLRWTDVDFKKAAITIPADRMKMNRDHMVPLSNQALCLLAELKKVTGNNELLFPGVKNNGKPISDVTLTKVLQVMGYIGENKVVPHGFRHTASTILNENSFNSDWIERQLAHVEKNSVRRAYNHAEYLDDRKKMMQWYADHLDVLYKKHKI
jgi:integrase